MLGLHCLWKYIFLSHSPIAYMIDMVKESCPTCETELQNHACPHCGYEKPNMEFNLPLHYSGGYTFQSDAQRRAFFAWLKETGRYIPNYSGSGRRGERHTSSSGYSLPDYSRIKGRRPGRASPVLNNPVYSAAKSAISAA